MRIACLGAGPAGLYFSILLKRARPGHEITVYDRGTPGAASGWGIVFSDRTLEGLRQADYQTHAEIVAAFRHWDDIDIFFGGERIHTGGHGFAGIGRTALLDILGRRATALGVRLRFGVELADPDTLAAGVDLLVAADGINSATRQRHADVFRPEIEAGACRYAWLGARRRLDAVTFAFRQTEWGWFNLHAYPVDAESSTFIVETPEDSWRRAGIERMPAAQALRFCEALFADLLAGTSLEIDPRPGGGAAWQTFQRVLCERWHHGNTVLIGDAAHSAHFAIGSGTKLAMEDAIALAGALRGWRGGADELAAALTRYQESRQGEVLRLQSAARNRREWFEQVARHSRLAPLQFSYSLLTGSQRLGHANLAGRDPDYVNRIETWLAGENGLPAAPRPPMFLPLTLRSMTLTNRVAVSPMAMYSCVDGLPGDFHLVHLGAFALGGAGLIISEMAAVSPEARISPACAGIWNDIQTAAWRRIVAFVHEHSAARIGMQLGHAGAKGATRVIWEGMDEPLAEGAWPLIAASALAWGPLNQLPREMDAADMARVRDDFAAAARRAAAAGFDLLELHCAHGYLLSSFLSPLTNRRRDAYGGPVENRCRFPLEVFAAVRAAWPADRPISVRISAVDWVPGGNTPDDAVVIAGLFKAAGADLIDVSSGLTTRDARPRYGRMHQTPLSDRIRNEVGIATLAVGNIAAADDVNTIIAAGRADLCALGRPHLADPQWTNRAAARQGYAPCQPPRQYAAGRTVLEQQLRRAAATDDGAP